MEKLSLNGIWDLHWIENGSQDIESSHMGKPAEELPVFLSSLKAVSAIPAQVPGNVELDLQQAGLLPDPFFADHIHLLRAFESRDWWYSKRFFVPDTFAAHRTEVVFEGLDTLATIWLNGQEIGRSANMLIPHRFDVTQVLRPGDENRLVVRLASVMGFANQQVYEPGMMSWEHRMEGLRLRKAPHMWGWDIMPRAVSAGVWRAVTLQTVPDHAIEELYTWTASAQPEHATLGIWFSVRTDAEIKDLHLEINAECEGHSFHFTWPLEFKADQFLIPIQNPSLWWPAGCGEPNLYTLTIRLIKGQQLLAERSERIGLRKLELLRTDGLSTAWKSQQPKNLPARIDQEWEERSHFIFRVNGYPVMVRGSNWVPLDAFHSRDADRLSQALGMIADLGCNMIRCWGGNVYESDAFFDWCDSHGVMVWQDFAFACCIYPQDEAFLETVQAEVQAVAKRLRNHASLALWCGDNEVDMVFASQGRNPQHNRLTRQAIPQTLQRCDPHRAYLPSSPYISAQVMQLSPDRTPEQHLWGPRGYFKGDFYTQHSAHFIGEIGYHGCPEPASLAKFISPGNLWPYTENDEWQVHSVYHWRTRTVARDRVALMEKQIQALFGMVPKSLADFAFASQVAQAEAKKFFIESTRQRKWHTSGILWWNLLDGWPQFSDAVVDYYFTKKLAYHYIQRAQRPVLLFLGEPILDARSGGLILPVILSNDSLADVEVSFRIWDADSLITQCEGKIACPSNQNWQAAAIPIQAQERRLFLLEWEGKDGVLGNHYLLAEPPLDLQQYRSWLKQIAALEQPFQWGDF